MAAKTTYAKYLEALERFDRACNILDDYASGSNKPSGLVRLEKNLEDTMTELKQLEQQMIDQDNLDYKRKVRLEGQRMVEIYNKANPCTTNHD